MDSPFVPNLSLVVIICMIIGYVICYTNQDLYLKLTLSPGRILLEHEYWRLISWVITVPYLLSMWSAIFLPIALYFYYRIGITLSYVWGERNFNLFILGGVFFIDLFVMIVAVVMYFVAPEYLAYDAVYAILSPAASYMPNWYIMLSMYLAIAYVNPDMKILLYFVIPVKIKYMAYIDIVFLAISFIFGSYYTKAIIFAVALNFLLFHLIHLKQGKVNPGQLKRRYEFRKRMKNAHIKKVYGNENVIPVDQRFVENNADAPKQGFQGGTIKNTRHRCAVCGRTELDDPELEFRFCSKCNGTFEYCSDHLFTHQHVK